MRSNEPTLILGDGVVTMGPRGTIGEPGGVAVVDGRIAGVGTTGELQRQFGNVPGERIRGMLLPGLVNAHVHLELSYQRGTRALGTGTHFTQWVSSLIKNYPPPEKLDAVVSEAAREGAMESLRHGVTCVGDISRVCGATRRALAGGPLRVVSFGEVVGLGTMREKWKAMFDCAGDRRGESDFVRIGISPHAPYTVEGPVLRSIVERAVAEKLPLAMHLGELSEEREFLATLGGKLGREWDLMLKMNIMDDQIATCPDGSVAWAKQYGLLAAAQRVPVLLAHVNYCDDAELRLLAESKASVVYCPRTRAFFGHDAAAPPHRYEDMLAAGVNVCLGTDSLASNPDLDLMREAAVLITRDGLEATRALELITLNGAKALGLAEERGSLESGKMADVIALAANSKGDLRELILDGQVEGVWIRGKRLDLHT